MTVMIELKEKMKEVYGAYSMYILPALKFVLAFAVFSSINRSLGYMELLNSIYIKMILSLICAIIPIKGIVVIGMFLIVGHCLALHYVVGGMALVLLLLLLILYLRFVPDEALALILTPAAFGLHIPAVIPIGFGLAGGPLSALSVACGVVLYYFLELIRGHIAALAAAEEVEILELARACVTGLLQNEEMLIMIIVCGCVVLIVNGIRSLRADYAWQIAVGAGGVSYIVIMLAGSLFLEVKVSVPLLIAGTIGSCVIGMILEFFLFGADYTRTESLRFEDDEYYYYVKAVPKYSVAKWEHQVQSTGRKRLQEQQENDTGMPVDDIRMEEPAFSADKAFSKKQEAFAEEVPREYREESADGGQPEEIPEDFVKIWTVAEQETEDAGTADDDGPAPAAEDAFADIDFQAKLEDTLKNL